MSCCKDSTVCFNDKIVKYFKIDYEYEDGSTGSTIIGVESYEDLLKELRQFKNALIDKVIWDGDMETFREAIRMQLFFIQDLINVFLKLIDLEKCLDKEGVDNLQGILDMVKNHMEELEDMVKVLYKELYKTE
ncbi:MAG: hypothetical protein DSY42_05135 [Aquifex sp.]|nr:MAG: hypothetical protein DSY42_05135 [Aquifex sp.]